MAVERKFADVCYNDSHQSADHSHRRPRLLSSSADKNDNRCYNMVSCFGDVSCGILTSVNFNGFYCFKN